MAAVTSVPYAAQVAQVVRDPGINEKIRKEQADNSQVMKTLHYLADVYGPRVTGSPNHKAAAEWAVKTMTSWGMVNGKLEPWAWNKPGWANEHLAVHAISPFKDALVVEALAWTPGTNGTVKAKAFNLVVPEGPLATPAADAPPAGRGGRGPARLNPTDAEVTAYLDSIKDHVKGAAVLVGRPISCRSTSTRRRDGRPMRRCAAATTKPRRTIRRARLCSRGAGDAAAVVAADAGSSRRTRRG